MSKVRTTATDLFTPDEHAILSDWFRVKSPTVDQDIVADEAINRLGFDKEPNLYRRIDAAVAFIVLERAEQRLPQWSAVRDHELILAREYRDRTKIRTEKSFCNHGICSQSIGPTPDQACRSGAATGPRHVLPFRKRSQQKPDSEELRAREQRKLDPRRQDLVRRIVEGHPETKWGPEELQKLHDELEAWGE